MEPIESDIRENFFPTIFVGEEVDDDLIETLGHGVKQGGIRIPDTRKLADQSHTMSLEACEALVKSLLGGANLNYVGHKSCLRKATSRARKNRERKESAVL